MRRFWVVCLVFLAGCGGSGDAAKPAPVPLGESRLAVPGGHIWYRVTGTQRGTPVVLLHGGPGFPSYYLKPLEALGDERVVIRYDQLGCGKSDSLTDTTMYTIEHFVNEMDVLRQHLGIEKWNVYGHSWGTILALEYYRVHPKNVSALVFASPVFDIPAFQKRANELIATLSEPSRRAVERALAAGRYDSPEYQNAINEFWGMYVFHHPPKEDFDSTLAGFNTRIYEYMQGPSEFTITGTLKDYDAKSFLPMIGVPALVTAGEFDEIGPDLARSHEAMMPAAHFELIPGSAHITTWDAPDTTVRIVRDFLRRADSMQAGSAEPQ